MVVCCFSKNSQSLLTHPFAYVIWNYLDCLLTFSVYGDDTQIEEVIDSLEVGMDTTDRSKIIEEGFLILVCVSVSISDQGD